MTSVGGGGNTLLDSRSDQNGATGVIMEGGTLMARTVSSKNEGGGVSFAGITGATLDRNRAAKNEGIGYVLSGDDLDVTRNRSNGNGVEAYNIHTTNSRYIDNSASDDQVGFHDEGTGNVFQGNRCDQIEVANSIPAGLCQGGIETEPLASALRVPPGAGGTRDGQAMDLERGADRRPGGGASGGPRAIGRTGDQGQTAGDVDGQGRRQGEADRRRPQVRHGSAAGRHGRGRARQARERARVERCRQAVRPAHGRRPRQGW